MSPQQAGGGRTARISIICIIWNAILLPGLVKFSLFAIKIPPRDLTETLDGMSALLSPGGEPSSPTRTAQPICRLRPSPIQFRGRVRFSAGPQRRRHISVGPRPHVPTSPPPCTVRLAELGEDYAVLRWGREEADTLPAEGSDQSVPEPGCFL